MVRRKAAEKHPAVWQESQEQSGNETLRALPNWHLLNDKEKQFMLLYPMYGSSEATSEALGMSKAWAGVHAKNNPHFKEIRDTLKDTRLAVMTGWLNDLLGETAMRLHEMVQKGFPDKRLQLEAIKHIHKSVNVGGIASTPANSGTYIRNQNITMFPGADRRGQPPVIEATVVKEEDDDRTTGNNGAGPTT